MQKVSLSELAFTNKIKRRNNPMEGIYKVSKFDGPYPQESHKTTQLIAAQILAFCLIVMQKLT